MCEYVIMTTNNDMVNNKVGESANYKKALNIYNEALKQKNLYTGLYQVCGDKLVAKKEKWRK